MSEPSRAVFLSYASEDFDLAHQICEALRAGGVEVWFDKSELRGGDAWDQKIRRQIRDCALFIPIISGTTASRHEGYFRLEWDLADKRTHMIARNREFIVPACPDATPDAGADVPESFLRVQWTRLPEGPTPAAFVERIVSLLAGAPPGAEPPRGPAKAVSAHSPPVRAAPGSSWLRPVPVIAALLALIALGYFAVQRVLPTKQAATSSAAPSGSPDTFAPPPHSIAVLPFVNMSGDKEQEYFSDGLTEELLNSLSRITELHVAARTSAFSFKGKDVDLGTIAKKLNVGAVLEGSVRRSEHKIRITAQLDDAVTGFHLWSETFDRDLGDVLKLQTDIANSVTSALKVTLLGGAAPTVELGATRNAAAFDAFLRGLQSARIATTPPQCRAAVDAFSEAIRLDADYALAYASRALTIWECASHYTPDWLHQSVADAVRADAERAVALAPGLVEGYVALSWLNAGLLDFQAAQDDCARALALAPNNDRALYYCTHTAGEVGQNDSAISSARHGVALDPLNPASHRLLGDMLKIARRYSEAVVGYRAAIAVDPEHSVEAYARLGLSYFLADNLPLAQKSCEAKPDYYESDVCLAIIYDKLGRHKDAAEKLNKLTRVGGEGAAYQYAQIHSQWGERDAALAWLEKAVRLRDPGLIHLKRDPLLDPLRKEPRFEAIERQLKFPT